MNQIKHISGLFLIVLILLVNGCDDPFRDLQAKARKTQQDIFVELASFEGSHLKEFLDVKISEASGSKKEVVFAGARWRIGAETDRIDGPGNAFSIRLQAEVLEGNPENVSLGVKILVPQWQEEDYILMPGAAYAGNRFRAIKKIRGKRFSEVYQMVPGEGPLLSNVPRLNIKGESKLQQLSGDMATPAVGYRSEKSGNGLFILSEQGTEKGYYSYKVWENETHDSATITMRIPGVREDTVYRGGSNYFFPSPDRGLSMDTNDILYLECNLYLFDAPEIQSVFDVYTDIRKEKGEHSIPDEMPYSYGWKLQEEKYNKQNWVGKYGYYSVGMRESTYQDWQTGWTGGMNAVYPLLVNGSDSTFQRAMRTFDFLFDTISPSGFFYDVFYEGQWVNTNQSTLLRRNSDALYFILKSYNLIGKKKPEAQIPQKWKEAARGCADAYVNLWNQYGEFGQWVNFNTGEITAPGTASNAIACGALALCSRYFDNPVYMKVAKSAAEDYYQKYVTRGFTNGGPGDAYQNTDSESAFGLLESFIVLYEETNDGKWLRYAKELGKQVSSWVVSYNFDFPPQSTFAKMDMRTTGTVIANVQNKHAAPGICSLSGNSLLKLYRYSDDSFYLDLIRDITKTMPQYMSRKDRPIPDVRPGMPWPVMPSGWINERVNMSDWEERGQPDNIRRGEIFGGSTWSEVAFMNARAEIPGIYILTDKKEITVLDNVEAELTEDGHVEIYNPTQFPAVVNIMSETSSQRTEILPDDYMLNFRKVEVPAGGRIVLSTE